MQARVQQSVAGCAGARSCSSNSTTRNFHGFDAGSLYDSPPVIVNAVRDYHKFLGGMRHCDQVLEPNARVDLVWHTHQQMLVRYRKDCL